jgi:ABC-type lipoprotein export system ATPase subunit
MIMLVSKSERKQELPKYSNKTLPIEWILYQLSGGQHGVAVARALVNKRYHSCRWASGN